jgi:uncharacterized protein YwqG
MAHKKESAVVDITSAPTLKKSDVGISKVDEFADLPKLIPWPSFQKKSVDYSMRSNVLTEKEVIVPLRFIAQIACSELPSELHKQGFPKIGLFYFFIEEKQDEFFDDEKDHFRVVYTDNSTERLAPRKQPKIPDVEPKDMTAYENGRMIFTMQSLGVKNENKLREEYSLVGGEAGWVQSSPFSEEEEGEWTLLLQFNTGICVLYFVIPTDDLLLKNMQTVKCFCQYG